MEKPAFKLGKTVITRTAQAFIEKHNINVHHLMDRHHSGDCGDASEESVMANLEAILTGKGKILSIYKLPPGEVWIMTEHDRSATTVMLPEDY